MMSLKALLYSDLARQYAAEGNHSTRPTLLGVLRRALHYRFLPVVLCRLSRAAMLSQIPVVPKLLTYLNIVLFGIEITPRCEIGPGILFPHTTGTVIGAWKLGSNVTVFQGVTLGAKVLDTAFSSAIRPEVGSDVVLGAGCKVLGGIRIGENVVVGANSVVLQSVESNTSVAGIPARTISKSAEQMA